jgi:hypothetical protein
MLCVLLLFPVYLFVWGGSVQEGGVCSSNNDHLDPDTLKFISDCTEQTFCSAAVNGTCVWRRCRRDQFPFAFLPSEPLPPMCPFGSFCPDQGNGCQPYATFGQPCQLNRDEQCAPPPDWQYLASAQNSNGSICLHSTCMCVHCDFFGTPNVNPIAQVCERDSWFALHNRQHNIHRYRS